MYFNVESTFSALKVTTAIELSGHYVTTTWKRGARG